MVREQKCLEDVTDEGEGGGRSHTLYLQLGISKGKKIRKEKAVENSYKSVDTITHMNSLHQKSCSLSPLFASVFY